MHRLVRQALGAGGRQRGLSTVEWSIAGDCYSPFLTVIEGRAERHTERYQYVGPGKPRPMWLELQTRCRRCERCAANRARRWYGAAKREIAASGRTWFGTLTLSPENHFRMAAIAAAGLAKQGVDFDTLSAAEQYRERHRAISPEITKYLKRIRKSTDTALRFLCVAEVHESGLPHYHMLVHEPPLAKGVTHRTLSTKWQLGFERWRLSDPQNPIAAAKYLSKYLSKSMDARVRASQGYGVTTSELHTHVIASLRKGLRELPLSDQNEVTEEIEEIFLGKGLDP